ncbi:hypothetical protein QYE76_050709 [Lolium multiflorum]|uniref:CCHC-type domain-containing protein n=1 Tax=Lolium multiflorum TaxID=4521 RepID=A0AAD8SRV3_LOLMU|nr:hypothetical protein QYE76_050709 [Lolium multiflorum]
MMNQSGPHHTKYRNNSSGGFTPRPNKPPAQNYRPNNNNNNRNTNNSRNNSNNNNNNNNNNTNNNNNHPNTAPVTGSNTVPVNPKDKSTVNCYECGVVGHFSNECPKKLARIAANTAAPAQQQRRFAGRRNQNNNNGRLYHMTARSSGSTPDHAKPHAPRHAHARQDAHGDAPERASTPARPVDSVLPSTSPFTCSLTVDPATSWTSPLARRSPVAVVTFDDCPPRYNTRASRSCSLQTPVFSAFKRVVITVT